MIGNLSNVNHLRNFVTFEIEDHFCMLSDPFVAADKFQTNSFFSFFVFLISCFMFCWQGNLQFHAATVAQHASYGLQILPIIGEESSTNVNLKSAISSCTQPSFKFCFDLLEILNIKLTWKHKNLTVKTIYHDIK